MSAQAITTTDSKKCRRKTPRLKRTSGPTWQIHLRADINAFIKTLIPTADHPKKFTQSEIDASVKTFKKRYWRIHYFSKYPAVYSLFTDQPVLNCENGDFEDGNLNGFILESSDASTEDGYNGGHCDWDPTSIMYTPEFEGFNEDNFLIVDDTEQDSITGFDMVHGGNLL